MPIIELNNGWKAFSEAVSSTMENGIDEFLKNKYVIIAILANDLFIANALCSINADLFIVTGEAGVGKSSFVKSITLEDVYIGSTLDSGKYPCTSSSYTREANYNRYDNNEFGACDDWRQTLPFSRYARLQHA
jgi:AAA15 family ATPase/GTPase